MFEHILDEIGRIIFHTEPLEIIGEEGTRLLGEDGGGNNGRKSRREGFSDDDDLLQVEITDGGTTGGVLGLDLLPPLSEGRSPRSSPPQPPPPLRVDCWNKVESSPGDVSLDDESVPRLLEFLLEI